MRYDTYVRFCICTTVFFTALISRAADPNSVVRVANDRLPKPLDEVPLAELDKVVPHHAGAEWPHDMVRTPLRPMVIRQGEDATTARYHEVTGFTFLINSMKRPRLVRMDSGRLVLVATAWLHETGAEAGMIITSDDDGQTWSQPRELTHGTLVNLGGKRLMVFADSGQTVFSDDDEYDQGSGFIVISICDD